MNFYEQKLKEKNNIQGKKLENKKKVKSSGKVLNRKTPSKNTKEKTHFK